ncbi:nucleotidyltransferase family protein [Rhodohalobacter sp. 8-1]|uniref:nucleotidyltransferase family protein n=1 Tax=Rhodohalobacter sp. 8-1 TaxID=3131972 RepID=UPI0030EBF0D6
MNTPENMGAVILAAGSSSRLGHPKQLVEYRGKSLLQHTIDCVDDFGFNPSLVVLGAKKDEILPSINRHSSSVFINHDWSEGIASSIRYGLEKSLELNPLMKQILYLLSDQPYVSSAIIRSIIDNHVTGSQLITACTYKDNIGVPAIFDKSLFPELMTLKGDTGAKKIMMQHHKNVQTIPFDNGAFDVDTKDDIDKLYAINQK